VRGHFKSVFTAVGVQDFFGVDTEVCMTCAISTVLYYTFCRRLASKGVDGDQHMSDVCLLVLATPSPTKDHSHISLGC
jgi:hypothetical protein